MLQVQTMSGDDFAFAVRLTDTMSWKLAEEDFQFMTAVEPEGCFIIRDAAERIGVATTIRFGQVGWLGNVIVREEHRGRGAGSLLVQHALDYLTTHGVQTIGLYAYPNRIPFYLRLGLVYDSDFLVLTGHADPPSEQDAPRAATAHDTRAILDLDHRCFGASRRKVLTPLLRAPENGCYVSLQEEALRGFVVKAALNRVRGHEVVVCLPANEAFLWRPLLRWGLREAFRVARMFYGSPQLTDCIHMAESLERG
jgi:GNAT superfamily N-acetyltransferase